MLPSTNSGKVTRMTIPHISARRDGGNMVATAHFGERNAVAAHREGSPFDASIQSLLNSVAVVGIAAEAAAERLQPTALVAAIRQGMRVEVRPAFERVDRKRPRLNSSH